jgi:hypothetical protein
MNKNNNYECHLVSRVLLKQFIDAKMNLGLIDKITKKKSVVRLTEADSVSLNVVSEVFKPYEQIWNKSEKHFPNVMNKIEDGSIFSSPVHIKSLKRFLAAHYVRSNAFIKQLGKRSHQAVLEIVGELSDPSITFEVANVDFLKSVYPQVPEMWKDNYQKVYSFIDSCYIEVGVSSKRRSFILSDTPVLNWIKSTNRVGIDEGVGIKADSVFFPISPKFIVSLTQVESSAGRYIQLSDKVVGAINKLSLRNAQKNCYYQEKAV